MLFSIFPPTSYCKWPYLKTYIKIRFQQLRRLFRCYRRILTEASMHMVQYGRLELLSNHLPSTGKRSMTYLLYVGFHPKPEPGIYSIALSIYNSNNLGCYQNPVPRRRFIENLEKFSVNVQTIANYMIRTCESRL